MRGALAEYRETVKRGLKANVRFLARAWNIPRATLERCISGNITGTDHTSGRKPILPEAAEKELATMLKLMSERGFPLTKKDAQQLAKAGNYWFQRF